VPIKNRLATKTEASAGSCTARGARRVRKGCSFLKKRTKKLLPIEPDTPATVRAQTGKSFLVLFFKKEHSFFFRYPV
jgi:hypothetical protein